MIERPHSNKYPYLTNSKIIASSPGALLFFNIAIATAIVLIPV